jgi:hypothetical protein
MDRFLIETPHRAEDCIALVELLDARGYLTHFDWGCFGGVHTGWAIVHAANEAEARLAVPPLVRGEARIVKVTKIDAEMFAGLHQCHLDINAVDRAVTMTA